MSNKWFTVIITDNTYHIPIQESLSVLIIKILLQVPMANVSIDIRENTQKVTDSYAIVICKRL